MASTALKNKWVWINTVFSEYAFKVKIKRIYKEADEWCYVVEHESGDIEPIFRNSVTRIFPVGKKKAKVLPLKRRLRLVREK